VSGSSSSRDYGRFDELAEDFAVRHRRGERPSLQAYVDGLPEMADEIREMFPAVAEVGLVEEDARDREQPTASRAIPRHRVALVDYRQIPRLGSRSHSLR
jgi:hypothetical protein